MAGYPPPQGGSSDPYHSSRQTPALPGSYDPFSPPSRYPAHPPPPPPPHRVPNADAYARPYVPPPPPPQMLANYLPAHLPVSAPAVLNNYTRQAFLQQSQPPPPLLSQQQPYYSAMGTLVYQQPPQVAQYSAPMNPYSGQPMYDYPQLAPPPQSSYPSQNPYDPYSAAMNAALARSYQDGYEGRGRNRHRGECHS